MRIRRNQANHRAQVTNKHLLCLSFFLTVVCVALLPIGSVSAGGAVDPDEAVLLPRGPDRTIDLSSFVGQTYLQAMLAQGNGIFDKTEADDAAAVTISNANEVETAVSQFVGETRADFVKLATRITQYEQDQKHHPELVDALVKLTPIPDKEISSTLRGDVLRRSLVYLNRPEFQGDLQKHPAEFANALAALLKQINADNAQITQFIQSNP